MNVIVVYVSETPFTDCLLYRFGKMLWDDVALGL